MIPISFVYIFKMDFSYVSQVNETINEWMIVKRSTMDSEFNDSSTQVNMQIHYHYYARKILCL